MTFYFKPPRGTITLRTLQSCIQERVKYIQHIESLDDLSNVEEIFEDQYLLDGSAFDRTGHYMLRLLSLDDDNISYLYKKYETILFEKRLKGLEPYQIRVELKTVKRHLTEILETSSPLPNYDKFLHSFFEVCQKLTQRDWANHGFASKHSPSCDDYFVEIPFTLCLPMIKQREVEIKNGIATIPCGKWQQFLVCLFQIHLEFGLNQLKTSGILEAAFEDTRMQLLTEVYHSSLRLFNRRNNDKHTLMSKDIDTKSTLFPPCMASLHKILRQRHRLTHDARFHYSLFLKDIGVPLDEATEFWRKEYMQPHTGCTTCSHSWQKDGKRYLYSIRHLYGLEGGRKNYKTPGCRQLQSMILGLNCEGGCPFVHHDEKKLVLTLSDEIRQNHEAIRSLLDINKKDGPQAACQKYFALICETHLKKGGSTINIATSIHKENPVRFYLGHRHENREL